MLSQRGYEKAELISPRRANLPLLGLGTSVGTPKGGITADVIAVESFDELAKIPDEKVKGKIVLFVPEWKGYGGTSHYRHNGATEASKKGAVAALIKSIAPFSIGSPHTGGQSYGNGVTPIPSACITIEDAEIILRLYNNGERVQVHLEMDDQNLPNTMSRNTIGEILGTNDAKNKSIVILSGHIDSWDVGVGAMDDGGGSYISWKALQYLQDMGLRPKRTLRAILWTGEEFGLWGAKQYEIDHKLNEVEEFNFMMESDSGTFTPLGLNASGNDDVQCILKEILKLMSPLNATQFGSPAGAPDLTSWLNRGFPGASLNNQNDKYFWFHHTAGDTMEVLNSTDLDKGTALFAATAYIVANLSIDMPKTVKN